MLEGKSIAVVVPAYNEAGQISIVINTMPDYIDKIVIIDDKSKDTTVQEIQDHQKSSDRIELIQHSKNQGVGAAIATGYKWARDQEFEIAVVMAGDGQMNPSDLKDIIAPVLNGEADYSKANRLLAKGARKKIPAIRLFGNSVLSFLTKVASGYWHIMDSQSGYTAINKKALQTIDWDEMYKRYGQPNDLLVRLNVDNFRVRDVITQPVYNVGEKSKMKVRKVVFTISFLLFRRFIWRMKEKYILREFNPLVFFYLLGVFMSGVSVILATRMLYVWATIGSIPPINALAVTFTFTIGLQAIFFAMLFDMESNRHLR